MCTECLHDCTLHQAGYRTVEPLTPASESRDKVLSASKLTQTVGSFSKDADSADCLSGSLRGTPRRHCCFQFSAVGCHSQSLARTAGVLEQLSTGVSVSLRRGGGGHTVRQVLAAHKDTVQVALSAAVGDIAPVLLLLNLPQLGKPVQYANLRPRVIAAPQCTPNIIFCTPANELNAGIPDTFIQ